MQMGGQHFKKDIQGVFIDSAATDCYLAKFMRVAKDTLDANNASWLYKAKTPKIPERMYRGLNVYAH